MASGTLVLLRHGESVWNLENRFTGWTDVPLTAKGRAEARAAAEKLAGFRFDYAFSSALVRAQETLEIILDVLGQRDVTVVYNEALNERHYGLLQGLNKAKTAEKLGLEIVTLWRRSYQFRPPRGESLADTRQRVVAYYRQRIEPHVLAGATVLVVAHANSLRALVMELDDIKPEAVPALRIPTGVPRLYRIDGDGRVDECRYL